jgi:hypothetical protein
MTTEPLRNKSTNGQPSSDNGGGFASRPERPESEVKLERKPGYAEIPILAHPRISTHVEDLPAYPAGLPEPSITFGYGDDHPGTLYVYLTVPAGDHGDEADVTVWSDEEGYEGNSISDGAEETGWTPDMDLEFVTWAHAVRKRLDADVTKVTESVLSTEVSDALVANALGNPGAEVSAIAGGRTEDMTAVDTALARAENVFAAYGGEDDLRYDLPDLLTDLRIFAEAQGFDWDQAMHKGASQYHDLQRDIREGIA